MRVSNVIVAGTIVGGVLFLSGCTPPAPVEDSVTSPTSFVATDKPAPATGTSTPEPSPTSTSGGTAADGRALTIPLITYAGFDGGSGVIEVVAFVPDIAELDGECSLSVTQGSDTVTAVQPSRPDATSTQCGSVFAELPSGASGEWMAVITYSSSQSTGNSAPVSIEVG